MQALSERGGASPAMARHRRSLSCTGASATRPPTRLARGALLLCQTSSAIGAGHGRPCCPPALSLRLTVGVLPLAQAIPMTTSTTRCPHSAASGRSHCACSAAGQHRRPGRRRGGDLVAAEARCPLPPSAGPWINPWRVGGGSTIGAARSDVVTADLATALASASAALRPPSPSSPPQPSPSPSPQPLPVPSASPQTKPPTSAQPLPVPSLSPPPSVVELHGGATPTSPAGASAVRRPTRSVLFVPCML